MHPATLVLAKPSTSWEMFAHVTNLFGYGMAISMIMTGLILMLAGYSWVKYSRESSRVPRLDDHAVLNGIFLPELLSIWAFMTANVYLSTASKTSGPSQTRVPFFVGVVMVPTFYCVMAALLKAEVNASYWGIDLLLVAVYIAVFMLCEVALRRRRFRHQKKSVAIQPIAGAGANPNAIRPRTRSLTPRKMRKLDVVLTLVPFFVGLVVTLAYPLAVVPLFLSSEPHWQLMMCLVLHPLLVQCSDVITRASLTQKVARDADDGGISEAIAEARIAQMNVGSRFIMKQLMAFYRRFMMLSLENPSLIFLAVTIAGIEGAFTRGFIRDIDVKIRSLCRMPPMAGFDLRLQSIMWVCDANQSCIAEFNSIASSVAAYVLLSTHSVAIAIGYSPGDISVDPAVVTMYLLLAVILEGMVSSSSLCRFNNEYTAVGFDQYFSLQGGCATFLFHAFASAASLLLVIFSFLRYPKLASCSSVDVCHCVDVPVFKPWYDTVCNSSSVDFGSSNYTLESDSFFAETDTFVLIMSLLGGISAFSIGMISSMIGRQRAKDRSLALLRSSLRTKEESARKQDKIVKELEEDNARMKLSLENAQQIVKTTLAKVNAKEGSFLEKYSIPFSNVTIGEGIGEGAFGTVHLGQWKGKEVAVKMVRTTKVSEKAIIDFLSEIKIMAPLQHRSLVELYGGCWESADQLCIILEYCAGGSLADSLRLAEQKKFTWGSHFRHLINGIAEAFVYLHGSPPSFSSPKGDPLIHRDLKPGNVLITSDYCAKVGDFGESRNFDFDETKTRRPSRADEEMLTMSIVGSPMYVAPEIICGNAYNTKVDVYSFAMMLMEVVCVCTNTPNRYVRDQYNSMGDTSIVSGWRPVFPEILRNTQIQALISQAWHQDPAERPTFKHIAEELQNISTIWDCDEVGSDNFSSFFEHRRERKRSKRKSIAITRQLARDRDKEKGMIRILMLGTANAGKSTVYKQLQLLHSKAFNTVEGRMPFAIQMRKNFVKLLASLASTVAEGTSSGEKAKRDSITIASLERASSGLIESVTDLPEEYVELLNTFNHAYAHAEDANDRALLQSAWKLWQHGVIQAELRRRKQSTNLPSNASRVAERAAALCADGYCPDIDDVLAARKKTIIQSTVLSVHSKLSQAFKKGSFSMEVTDPGGQTSLRRKWQVTFTSAESDRTYKVKIVDPSFEKLRRLPLFSGVHAVIFVTALTDYSTKFSKPGKENGLRESLQVFGEIMKAQDLSKASVALFLNKDDLFKERIKKDSIGNYFGSAPKGKKGREYERALNFIKHRFKEKAQGQEGRLKFFVTNATDCTQAGAVLDQVVMDFTVSNLQALPGGYPG